MNLANILVVLLSLCSTLVFGASAKSAPDPVPAAILASEEATTLAIADLKTIQEKLRSNHFLALEFQQKNYKQLRNKTVFGAGRAVFMRPDKFHWSVTSPIKDEWIYDGSSLINYHPDEKQAVKYQAGESKNKELRRLVDVILNLDTLLNEYDLKGATRKGDRAELELSPKKQEEIRQVGLTIDLKKNYISWVKLTFNSKDFSEFTFINPQFAKLSATEFQVPKGIVPTVLAP